MDDLIKGRYVARLARFEEVHPLRRAVFRSGACDRDMFDTRCDHIAIELQGEIVCCYRLLRLRGDAIHTSYAAQFYDLGGLSNHSGGMVEMGRFCIHPGHSDPDILRIAWAMLARYVKAHGIGMIFGCSSFEGQSPGPYGPVFDLLASRHLGPLNQRPHVRAPQTVPLRTNLDFDRKEALRLMPPLLRSYLSSGGWVGDHAVIDPDLGTIHVFTALEVAMIPPGRRKVLEALAS